MNLGVEIFVLVLACIGVTFSSPASVSSSVSDAGPKEKPPVVDPVTPVATTLPPVNQTTEHLPSNATIPSTNTTKNATEVPAKPNPPPVIDNKNTTTVDVKNATTGNTTEIIPQTTTVTPAPVTDKTTAKPAQTNVSTTTTTQKPSTATPITTTTSAPVNAQTTAAEHAQPAPAQQERQFDGPSFVGGIVLTIGLTAIGFIAFKFYKSGKIERDYRTL